jgi:NAD(P)H-dependent FMN reductase
MGRVVCSISNRPPAFLFLFSPFLEELMKSTKKTKRRPRRAKLLIISCSLNPQSRSRLLAEYAATLAMKKKHDVELVDLRHFELPLCDGESAFTHANSLALASKIKQASAILLAVPVYNYNVSAAAKNLIECTGSAWDDKVVGFLVAAGGKMSYMAILPLANSLLLDFRCLITPQIVYADKSAFTTNQLTSEDITQRVANLLTQMTALAKKTRS